MKPSFLIRVEFATIPPFMYSVEGVLLSDAVKSATQFMDIVDVKKPLKSEIWGANYYALLAIVDHEKRDLEG